MPHLYRHLRIHQVFGANTDVGKTIFTTLLCKAGVRPSNTEKAAATVHYLKPVSTGPDSDADDSHVARFVGQHVKPACLFKYDDPVSPHLAVAMKGVPRDAVPSDQTFVDAISRHLYSVAQAASQTQQSCMYLETAGGVHSPTSSGTTQAEAYRPLRLPTILVGDPNLGGISSTISAYESLHLRGYDVESLLIFREDYYKNWEYLSKWFADRNRSDSERPIHVGVVPRPPSRLQDSLQDRAALQNYYDDTAHTEAIQDVVGHLDTMHTKRIEGVESMPRRTLDQVWWPFVQHGAIKGEQEVTVIDSAQGDHFDAFHPKLDPSPPSKLPSASLLNPLYDGSASWWTQSLGHANSDLTLAAAYAAGRYGHVIFPLAIHEPALSLAERLIRGPGRGWAARAFFSDNGSTGMEVALKMALRAASLRYKAPGDGKQKELGVIGLKGSYHGDTIGAMDACEGGAYSATVDWYRGRGYWFDVPTAGFKDGRLYVSGSEGDWKPPSTIANNGKASWNVELTSTTELYDVEARILTPLAGFYRAHIQETVERLVKEGRAFGALVIEPLVMGAGGMLFVDPLFHRVLVDVVRQNSDLFARARGATPSPTPANSWTGLPVIFDEVFTGLYRVGVLSATSILKVNPDISVLAKILTGGLLPLSVTLASSAIFDAFSSEHKVDALLHGHSYTAHPIGCAVANKSLSLISELSKSGAWKDARRAWAVETAHHAEAWSFWNPHFVRGLSRHSRVEHAMALGTVLAFQLRDPIGGYTSNLAREVLEPLGEPDSRGAAIHFRTLGDVAYFMASLNTPEATFRSLEARILSLITETR